MNALTVLDHAAKRYTAGSRAGQNLRAAKADLTELVKRASNLANYLDGYLYWQREQGNDPTGLAIAEHDITSFYDALARVKDTD